MSNANPPQLLLGAEGSFGAQSATTAARLPTHHLTTHAVVLGMTGSGKTGLAMVLIEEALRAGVSCLVFDVKGDLPNLLLAFPTLDASALEPWVEGMMQAGDVRPVADVARDSAEARAKRLASWGIGERELAAYANGVRFRVLTPGATAGEPVHLLASLEQRSARWDDDPEAARGALGAAVSLVLRLVGRDPDPARNREHVVLSVLAERRHLRREPADLASLLADLADPPIATVGALALDDYLPRSERRTLAAALNSLLAAPSFATWRTGAPLDVGRWLAPDADGRPACVVVSVAHLDDDERLLVLGLLLEEVLTWTRGLSGTQSLRALIAFDEVYGFLPPHPHSPPTKKPLVSLLKQGRAFGVGVVLATQNPMDLDYRALSNAGLWFVGRLQTDADRARVVEGLGLAGTRAETAALAATLKKLVPRWFLVKNAHRGDLLTILRPRECLSFMRGPMTRAEIVRVRLRGGGGGSGGRTSDVPRDPVGVSGSAIAG